MATKWRLAYMLTSFGMRKGVIKWQNSIVELVWNGNIVEVDIKSIAPRLVYKKKHSIYISHYTVYPLKCKVN